MCPGRATSGESARSTTSSKLVSTDFGAHFPNRKKGLRHDEKVFFGSVRDHHRICSDW